LKIYNKLIRDKIPETINGNNKIPDIEILSPKDSIPYLRAKLNEEIREFDVSKDPEELADILEVVYNLGKRYGYSEAYIESIRQNKNKERGSFDRNILLKSVKEKEQI